MVAFKDSERGVALTKEALGAFVTARKQPHKQLCDSMKGYAKPFVTKKSLRGQAEVCYCVNPMSIAKKPAFSRRLPDLVTEELASVLSQKSAYEFKDLFDVVHENLKARNAASGGEEMLRLRAYEKLQNLVGRGMVKITVGKNGKKSYKGLAKQLATLETGVTPAI